MRTPGQIKAARALLGWTQPQLSKKTGISVPTLKRIESQGTGSTSVKFAEKIDQVFQDAGIEFIQENGGGAGVRFKKPRKA